MKTPKNSQPASRRKRTALLILVVIAVAAVILAAAISLAGKIFSSGSDASDESGQDSLVIPEAAASTEEQIEALIAEYRTAFTNADIEALKTIYNTDEIMNSDVIEATAEIITGYENTTCYIKDGPEENTYIVFIYDELVISGLETAVPNISYVYVCLTEDGTLYIDPGEYSTASSDYVYSTDVLKYINELIEDDDISDLYAEVNESLSEVMDADSDVKAFLESLSADDALEDTSAD